MPTSRVLVPLAVCLLSAGVCRAADDVVVAAAPTATAAPGTSTSAVLPTAQAARRWEASGSVEQGGYRVSLARGRLDLGMRFEPRLASTLPIDARFDSAAPPGAALPSLSFGLRTVSSSPAPASSLIERALGSTTSVPNVSKVGIEWKPAQSQVFFHQGLGVRLGGDDRLVMRLRKGSLGVYMQKTF